MLIHSFSCYSFQPTASIMKLMKYVLPDLLRYWLLQECQWQLGKKWQTPRKILLHFWNLVQSFLQILMLQIEVKMKRTTRIWSQSYLMKEVNKLVFPVWTTGFESVSYHKQSEFDFLSLVPSRMCLSASQSYRSILKWQECHCSTCT